MAINPSALYTGRIDVTDPTGYPFGKCQNETAPAADDGTPSDEAWMNDMWGFLQFLLSRAGITPTGNPDKVNASDYSDALDALYAKLTDSRFPTSDEKAALVGTGTPGAGNTYVTDDDPRLAGSAQNTMIVQDVKTSGIAGQTLLVGSNIRDLNTVVVNTIAGASLNSNQLTLPAGTYEVFAKTRETTDGSASTDGGRNLVNMYDVSNSGDLVWDMRTSYSVFSEGEVDGIQSLSNQFVLVATTVVDLRHYCQRATNGGYPSLTGLAEIYSTVILKKVS